MEPTKECAICKHRKPWSAFYTTPRGGPRWACSKCESAGAAKRLRDRRAANPEPFREAQRNRYHINRQNPEWVAERREYNRQQAERGRRARGVPETTKRGPMGTGVRDEAELLDAAPFVAWMLYIMDRDDVGSTALAQRLGMPDSVRRYVNGTSKHVPLAVVDAAVQKEGSMTLRDIYPDLYGCIERTDAVSS